jgi:4'-phosphopantetheinyl transferase
VSPAPAPARPAVSPHEVHVWIASLDRPAGWLGKLAGALSSDERRRAERLRFPRDRERFVVARGLLRTILSGYLGDDPADLRFRYECRCGSKCALTRRKPELATEPGRVGLTFNVSHSGGLALYAISDGRRVGVDLERLSAPPADELLAAGVFSDGEQAALRSRAGPLRHREVLLAWTRKEAYVKGRGEGLGLPLGAFEVMTGDHGPVLRSLGHDPAGLGRWSLYDLALGPSYVGALAVEGSAVRVRTRWWSDEPAGSERSWHE